MSPGCAGVHPSSFLVISLEARTLSLEVSVTDRLGDLVRDTLADGRLIQVVPEWADETYPLYAFHHSAQLMSTKVRAFLDFVIALTRS